MPPCDTELVVIETSVKPPTLPCKAKVFAPFESVLLVTIYSKVIKLPVSSFLR